MSCWFYRLASGVALFYALLQGASATGCYDPTWDVKRAQRVSFGPEAVFPVEVRTAGEATGDSSLLLVQGADKDYVCVPVGPRVRGVNYPFQTVERIEALPLSGVQLLAISGKYRVGSDCCRLVQFVRIAPHTGAVSFNAHGGFALPLLAQIHYGITDAGKLVVVTATRVIGDQERLEGAHRFLLERYLYSSTAASFVKTASRHTHATYDIAAKPADIFAQEHFGLQ